jgi:HAD superfamily hydrolase (TIGR01509 family)
MKRSPCGTFKVMPASVESPQHSIFLSEPKTKIDAILFDMDGVLVDSIPVHLKAWNSVLSEMNMPALDQKTYLSVLGRTNLDMLTKYLNLQNIKMSLSLKRDFINTKEQHFREIIKENIKPTPGVFDWLDFFKQNRIRCSVASSGEMANILVVLEALHVSDYFISIISGAHLPASKPNPLVFTLAAASLGVDPDKCMVIEDAPAGIQAAKSANMLCCAIATTFSSDELTQADLVLDNLSKVHPETLFIN